MTTKSITSVHNQRVKDAAKLRDHRQRARQGRFPIDGAREALAALSGRLRLLEAFVCEPLCKSSASREARERLVASGAEVFEVTPEVFDRLAFGERHEGVLLIAETPRSSLAELDVPPESLVAIVEGLEKPGNVGAILRSADASGVAAVIVCDGRTDLYNPNCIRASLGTIFAMRVCQSKAADTAAWLHKRGCKVFAARLDALRSYSDVDFRGDAAIVLGSEAAGLSSAWQAVDITAIRLPMQGTADSLNVSATAAVLFYEALRQRGSG